METKLSIYRSPESINSAPEVSPKFIFATNPHPGIYSEEKAIYQLFNGADQGIISLKYFKSNGWPHFFWAWATDFGEEYVSVFEDDYVPRNIYNRKLHKLNIGNFFEYKNRLYIVLETLDGCLHIEEFDIHTTEFEARAMSKIQQMKSDAELYITKVSLIHHNNKAYDLFGYCWRAVDDNFTQDLPIFRDDYSKIIRANYNELHYEEMEPGETFLHDGILWKIHYTKECGIFLLPTSVPMRIIKNNIINH